MLIGICEMAPQVNRSSQVDFSWLFRLVTCSSEKRVNKTVNNHYISQSLVMKISRDKAEFALAGMTFAGMSRDEP